MRRDVKRFLLFWPAITSMTIIGLAILIDTRMTWQSVIAEASGDASARVRTPAREDFGSNSWEPPVVVEHAPKKPSRPRIQLHCDPLHEVVEPSPHEIAVHERMEHGSRAMQVPQRIATALGIDQRGGILAPSRDELQELAGYVLQPANESSEDIVDLSDELFAGNILAAERIAADNEIAADRELGLSTLGRVTDRTSAFAKSNIELHLPSQPELPMEIDDIFGIAINDLPAPADDLNAPLNLDIATDVFADKASPAPVKPTSSKPPAVPRESVMPKSIANLAKVIPRISEEDDLPSQPQADSPAPAKKESVREATMARTRMHGNPATWPQTPRLSEQLQAVQNIATRSAQFAGSRSSVESGATWSEEVSERLAEMRTLPRLGEPRAGELIEELRQLAKLGYRYGESATNREEQIQWLTAAHAVNRRVEIWSPIWRTVNTSSSSWTSDAAETTDASTIVPIIGQIRRELHETGDAAGWDKYLMLPEIAGAATKDVDKRTIVAQRFLSRLDWHGLDPVHRDWLNRPSVNQLIQAVQPWARTAVDYASLLNQIERQEADSIDLAAVDIAGAVQTLRFADNPKAGDVAAALETHYRNANVRIALSEELMRRMLPEIEPTTAPVRTTMFGSRVRGVSEIRSDLELNLQPSPDRWSLNIRTLGDIHTQSVGEKGSTAVSTRANSSFTAETPIQITPNGIQLGDSNIDVQGSTRLRGIRTNFDNWPLLGNLVRGIAATRFRDSSRMTTRIANRRVHDKLSKEIDERLGEKAELRTKQFNDFVMGPLSGLRLSPKVVDMKTTEDRLVARYRVAGDWQIGAFTPRPRAPKASLMSLQVNQSALNNTLQQVVPLDAPTTIEDAVNNTMTIFGLENTTMPEDIPRDVTIQFTKTRPVTVELKDGLAWITLRVVELSKGEKFKLRRFIVRAAYRPEVNGLNVSLVRDGHLRVSGPGMTMRQRLPVRAIFNKVLSPNHAIAITQPGLADHVAMKNAGVSQLELRDGWLALAFSPLGSETPSDSSDRVAEEAANSSKR